MDSLGNNRYQLLFIDDESSDLCIGQKKLQQSEDNSKSKCKKLGGSEKMKSMVLGKKAKSNGKGEPGSKANRNKMSNNRQKLELKKPNMEQEPQQPQQQQKSLQVQQQNVNLPKPQKNVSLQKQQQQQQQHQQLQQELQQQQLDPPKPERHYRERTVLSRIINNSNKGGGYGRLPKGKFDRHSGSDKTGIKAVVKRNGGGAHNWGSVIKDIEEQSIAMKNPILADKDDLFNEQSSPQHQQQHQQQQQQQQGENSHEEDSTKYITVEEWRAMRVERAKPIYNIRKPGEGEVTKPDWKKMTVLPKKKQLKTDSDPAMEYDASMYPQRVGRLQRVMNIEFKFKDDRRRSGYLSGWAGGRSLNKSADNGGNDPINMNDEAEFPTLG